MQIQKQVWINKYVCTTVGCPSLRNIKPAMTVGHHSEVDTKQQ